MAHYHLLIVDHEDAILQAISKILGRQSYIISMAHSGAEALSKIETINIDLILANQRMPDMSGLDILKASTELAPEAIRILMTDDRKLDTRIAAVYQANIYQYLLKPFEAIQLQKTVENALDHREIRRALAMLEAESMAKTSELIAVNKKLSKLIHEKKDFLTITSHELKTPATLIAGYADLILMKNLVPENDLGLLSLLRNGIQWLSDVVNDLIEEVRIDSRKLRLHRRLVHLGQIVQEAILWLRPFMEDRDLKIMVLNSAEMPKVYADRDRLRDVFVNLLGNAIKFTPDGGEIRISTKVDYGYCHVFVQDTGIGIPEDSCERIFEPFFTLGDTMHHSSSKTAFMGGGIGLGLTICRGIIQAHGGMIWAESKGKSYGSTFQFTLPLPEEE